MSKITIATVGSIPQNPTSAVTAINNNFATISHAIDNTLSRDGSNPNQMTSSLDMNSNQILNLPAPGSPFSPVRLTDVTTGIPTITAATGTSGHVVPFLDGNNTWSGKNIFTGKAEFKGSPWYDVTAYGAVGDYFTTGTDNTSAFLAAAADCSATGGILFVPPGNYLVSGTITISGNTTLMGAGRTASYIQSKTDATVIILDGATGQNNMRDIAILGKGSSGNVDHGSVGAVNPAVLHQSSGAHITNCTITGGNNSLQINNAPDTFLYNVSCSESFGAANVNINNSGGFYCNCIFDVVTPYNGVAPFPNRANTTAYTTGQVIVYSTGYAYVCTASGTTAGSEPSGVNYGINLIDGSATFRLLSPGNYTAMSMTGTAGENFFSQCDFSGPYFNTIAVNTTNPIGNCYLNGCVVGGAQVEVLAGGAFSAVNSELCSVATATGYTGRLIINGCYLSSNGTFISVGTPATYFNISNNILTGGAISIANGCSHFVLTNNIGTTVTDSSGGVTKTVSGNFS